MRIKKIVSFVEQLKHKEVYYPVILIVGTLILTLFGIHGSSIGAFHQMYRGVERDDSLIFGVPRGIRSDEWAIGSQYFIGQAENDLQLVNDNMGDGLNMSFLNFAPTKHWSNIFEVTEWGFFVLPLEQAFAFRWLARGLILLLSSYLLMMVLTQKKIILSIAFSIAVVFNPFIQWWYATTAVENIGYGLLIVFFLTKCFNHKNWKDLSLYTFLLAFSLVSFVNNLYPPFQIPIVLGCIFLFGGYLLNNLHVFSKKRILNFALSLFVALGACGAFLYSYYVEFKSIIDIMQNTSYPGKRVVVGGDYSLLSFLSNVFHVRLLFNSASIPNIWGNQCEAAKFLGFPFLTILVSLYFNIKEYIKSKKIDFILFSLSLYLIFSLLWLFVGFTPFMAKYSLLSMVPTNRMILGIGVFELILMFYLLGKKDLKKSLDYKIFIFLLAVVYLLINLYVGNTLWLNYPEFIGGIKWIWCPSILFAINFLLWGLSKEKLFAITFTFTSLFYSFAVNPIYRGLDPVIKSDFAVSAKEIASESPDSQWAVYEYWFLANNLMANGVDVINGTHVYPQFEFWKTIDPESQNYDLYNRYAQVPFRYIEDDNEIKMEVPQGDLIFLNINPCNEKLKGLNIDFFVLPVEIQSECVELKDYIESSNLPIYIYKRK